MRQLPLRATASVTLGGSGAGTAYVGPLSAGEQWSSIQASVRVATNVSEALCSIYAGAGTSAGYYADGTTWGSTGDSTTNIPPVHVGGSVWAVWSGGDAGSQATLTVTGIRTVA